MRDSGLMLASIVGLVGVGLTAGAPGAGVAAAPAMTEHRIVVVTPSTTDQRLVSLREAAAFWNRALVELGLDARLVVVEVRVAPPETRALENYTRQIWQQAGRTRPGASGPAVPEALSRLDGDVVAFFSAQPTMSFAWPLYPTPRYFVAVPEEPGSRLRRAGSTRNVIAHELGHTLGLIHQRNPVVLMCSPCRPTQATEDADGFLPLTEIDRDRLRTVLSAN